MRIACSQIMSQQLAFGDVVRDFVGVRVGRVGRRQRRRRVGNQLHRVDVAVTSPCRRGVDVDGRRRRDVLVAGRRRAIVARVPPARREEERPPPTLQASSCVLRGGDASTAAGDPAVGEVTRRRRWRRRAVRSDRRRRRRAGTSLCQPASVVQGAPGDRRRHAAARRRQRRRSQSRCYIASGCHVVHSNRGRSDRRVRDRVSTDDQRTGVVDRRKRVGQRNPAGVERKRLKSVDAQPLRFQQRRGRAH